MRLHLYRPGGPKPFEITLHATGVSRRKTEPLIQEAAASLVIQTQRLQQHLTNLDTFSRKQAPAGNLQNEPKPAQPDRPTMSESMIQVWPYQGRWALVRFGQWVEIRSGPAGVERGDVYYSCYQYIDRQGNYYGGGRTFHSADEFYQGKARVSDASGVIEWIDENAG